MRLRRTDPLLSIALVAAAALPACRDALGIEERPTLVLDAGADAAGEASSFCDQVVPTPAFCDDFDHESVVERWDNHNRNPDIGASGGGVIASDLVNFQSRPRAASLSLPGLADPNLTASAVLQGTLTDPAPVDLTIEMELLVESEYFPPQSGVVGFMTMSYAEEPEWGLLRRDSGTWLTVGRDTAVRLTTPLVVGRWVTLTVTVRNQPTGDGTPNGHIDVYVNHLRAAEAALPARLQTNLQQRLVLGPITKGPMGAFRMVIDNVRLWPRSDL